MQARKSHDTLCYHGYVYNEKIAKLAFMDSF
jgi:hypothetical protein